MNKIKYDSEIIKLITLFESMTGAKVRDCMANDKLIYIIEENEMGKAIGKSGANIKRLENALKKKIKLVEFSSDVAQFVKNMIHPLEAPVTYAEGIVTIQGKDTNTRAMIIGREKQNLNHLASIVKRYFDVKEIKVV